ncbi:FACT complex subunit spt16 [Neolecta irregularis DAH-3]|uniref:FACT complex subunit n=1 Tax=Neolecta irregularis (strain DAH-3) TaxID=1198029 RepID=A0A1U7LVT1_NEOID|nr:FACT complex subunit spt16 [Neolecta irregularis DAH-3]|eukprot:OLL26729.1 FACT complex subunit spt16 [Neolecta irregularis DAH-3]
MSEVKIDSRLFHKRIRQFIRIWKSGNEDLFQGASSLLVVVGSSDEDNPYQKSTALHQWLLGYEFPAMLMVITQNKVLFLTSASKAKHLDAVSSGGDGKIAIDIMKRTKDEKHNADLWTKAVDIIESAGKRVGIFAKDQFKGKFVDEWKEVYGKLDKFQEVDVSTGLLHVMSVKDEDELKHIRIACKASAVLMTNYFADEMSKYIDEERKVSHSKFSTIIESKIEDDKFLKSKPLRIPSEMDLDQIEWCYNPIVQSGGEYDLKPSAQSNDNLLHGGTIICSFGLRYKAYCSNIGRTFFIDPNQDQEKYYNFLIGLQKKVFESIKDGVVVKDVFNKAISIIKSRHPELESHFVKNLGAGLGIEFRDSSLVLNAKNNRPLKEGMILNISIGFDGLENPNPSDPKSKNYSLLVIDVIRVTADAPVVLTETPKQIGDVSFYFKDELSEVEKPFPTKTERKSAPKNIPLAKSKTRNERKSDTLKRQEHQKRLAQQKHEDGLKRFPDGSSVQNGTESKVLRRFESYKRENQLPPSVRDLKIVVDRKAQSILLPIFGRPVPFHISTLKNISKNDEGDYIYLRMNFLSPGQGVGRKDTDMGVSDDPNANFLRSLTFRSSDVERMAEIFKDIQELKKNAQKKEAERKEFADVIEQDTLVEVKNRRPHRLGEVFLRPALDGKRVGGELEIHQNGLRYQSPLRSDHRVDLLFTNIQHLFFQPCDQELIVIIHVHLKSPIMIGKKKAKDIQFYREASDIQFDETGNRKRKYRYGDEDELEAEQEDRRRRAQLNKEFRAFSEKISEAGADRDISVDVPVRELAFNGVPYRSNVLCQPTTYCLVHLTDPPFMVLTLADLEIVHLERVQFGLKNFDMVFIFKDFQKAPSHINSIPMTQIEGVKEWLDSNDIAYTEGPLNLNWGQIMKTINDDPAAFFREGGWGFLGTGSDEDSEGSEPESEFQASSEVGEESSEEEGNDFDDDASDDEGSEDDESVESGEDWDELEKKAKDCKLI